MTAIADLTLPANLETIRGIIYDVPQGTVDRVPTTEYTIADDSGDVRVIYDQDTSLRAEMFQLEDGQRVELTGVRLPMGRSGVARFLVVSGKVVKK